MNLYSTLKFLLLIFSFFFKEALAQDRVKFTVSFYNVENLFDTQNDPQKRDDEFTPEGKKRWNRTRLYDKLSDLSQVIRAIGVEQPPDIIGLAEVENRSMLELLISQDALKQHPYRILHKDAPDRRGIDVALLYRPDTFHLLRSCTIPILSQEDSLSLITRDIHYACGVVRRTDDTLHIFVNHFPSRWGGKRQSQPKRKLVANKLREEVRWHAQKHPKAKVIIMGDFNDTPEDVSIREVLGAIPLKKYHRDSVSHPALINISQDTVTPGSYIYRGKWQQLDQIIVSTPLFLEYHCQFSNTAFPVLFEASRSQLGIRIHRTYHGFRYHGGVSDHLPVTLYIDKH